LLCGTERRLWFSAFFQPFGRKNAFFLRNPPIVRVVVPPKQPSKAHTKAFLIKNLKFFTNSLKKGLHYQHYMSIF
jgi:hypothetical protein